MHFLTLSQNSGQGEFIDAIMEGEVVIQAVSLDEGTFRGIAVYAPGYATPAIQGAYPWTSSLDMSGAGFGGWTRFLTPCLDEQETNEKWAEIMKLIKQL